VAGTGAALRSLLDAIMKSRSIPQPMEAVLADDLPMGGGWQFEPKWDGFRALALREGDEVELWSKSGKPLGRYFPDIVDMLRGLAAKRFLLDGELIIPVGDSLSFAALQARLHPSASRVDKLVAEAPAQFMLFDCLQLGETFLADKPLVERRAALEAFHAAHALPRLMLSPRTEEAQVARNWLAGSGGALDGIVAKPLGEPYRAGERAMRKVKQLRTADCVVGGYRQGAKGSVSLLLGLYDEDGLLDHVGFTSSFAAADRAEILQRVTGAKGEPGFTGDAPGAPSRWSGVAKPYVKLRHALVAEVVYDQVSAGRFRHGTRFLRWRPDKAPAQCTRDQLIRELRPAELEVILAKA